MNRGFILASAAGLTIAISGVGARADDRSEIDALYAKLTAALKNKTPEAITALEAPGFTSTSAGKTINGKQLLEQMKQRNATSGPIKDVSVSVKKADIKGKSAKVVSDFSYTVEVVDKDGHMGAKGGTHEMSMSGLVKNDLVKTYGGWKFLTMQQGAGKMLVDGKPVGPAPPGTRKVPKR